MQTVFQRKEFGDHLEAISVAGGICTTAGFSSGVTVTCLLPDSQPGLASSTVVVLRTTVKLGREAKALCSLFDHFQLGATYTVNPCCLCADSLRGGSAGTIPTAAMSKPATLWAPLFNDLRQHATGAYMLASFTLGNDLLPYTLPDGALRLVG